MTTTSIIITSTITITIIATTTTTTTTGKISTYLLHVILRVLLHSLAELGPEGIVRNNINLGDGVDSADAHSEHFRAAIELRGASRLT